MAEQDGQERTEAATPRRREEARREGRVPRSQELSGAALLLAGTGALALAGGAALAEHTVKIVRAGGAWLTADPITPAGAIVLLEQVARETMLALLPFLAGVLAFTLLVNAVQARGVIAIEPVVPKLSHIDPIQGLRRLLSAEALFNLLKSIIKLLIIGWVAWTVFHHAWLEILSTSGAPVPNILAETRGLTIRLAFLVGLAFLAVAGLDYAFQLWQYERKLRMTRQEVIQEHKDTEGDPAIKGRIRQLQRAMARKRMLSRVATADVVVTNPTHVAVALKYDPLIAAAPIVVAMGERLLAQRIKDLARQAGVPIIENPPLARALLANAELGKAIPPALYVAVAEVIAFVFRMRGTALPVRRSE
ncbi:MAG TPA: flagellar biosynthesis protein FlhB [Gemmatimonadales bacterium]|nr:flagellar biosynthesis protein FlhB [Gemmatimonadales bacterium]